jgi:type IV pilus assembly protein PilA
MIKILKNKKGFTLIELVVVIAILAILAAIAIPKFANMRIESAVKADAGTAAQIANACRIQEAQTGKVVTSLTQSATPGEGELLPTYMVVPTPQTNSAGTFGISGGGDTPYVITFTPSGYDPYDHQQSFTEHTTFTAVDHD